jgi:Flp pilus assembly protein TadD
VADPAAALDLAKRAVGRSPKSGHCHHTLGVAQYRTGDMAGCVRSMEMSMELRGGDAYEYLMLAMAYARRGDLKQARWWHERADKWRKHNPAKDSDELRSFAQEARELIEGKKAGPAR